MGRLVTAARHGAVTAAVAAFVGLGAAAGSLYWERVEQRGEVAARAELPALALAEVPKVFGFDYQTVERSLMETYPLLTGDFRHEFQDRANNEIIPEARKQQLVITVDVVGSGVVTAARNSGSVLVYVDRTIVDKRQKKMYDGSRIRVDYRRIDGKWLIEHIAPV